MPSAASRDTSTEVWPLQRRSRLNTSKYLLTEANSIAAKSLTTFASRNRFGKESCDSGTPGQQPRLLPPPAWRGDGSYSLDIFSSLLVTLAGHGDTVAQPKCSAALHAVRHTCITCGPPCIQTSPVVQHRRNWVVLGWSTLPPAPQHLCRVAMETIN